MADKLNQGFKDPSIMPTEEIISSHVGAKMILWNDILTHASNNYKEVSGSWNYYKDGKQWLFKFVQKKKTLFWAGIFDGTFNITFYFGDKAEPVIMDSNLPEILKEGFRNAKRYGTIRPISIVLNEHSDSENVYKLIYLKSKIK